MKLRHVAKEIIENCLHAFKFFLIDSYDYILNYTSKSIIVSDGFCQLIKNNILSQVDTRYSVETNCDKSIGNSDIDCDP